MDLARKGVLPAIAPPQGAALNGLASGSFGGVYAEVAVFAHVVEPSPLLGGHQDRGLKRDGKPLTDFRYLGSVLSYRVRCHLSLLSPALGGFIQPARLTSLYASEGRIDIL